VPGFIPESCPASFRNADRDDFGILPTLLRNPQEGQTKVIRAALTALAEAKRVLKTGDGTKGKPFLYEFQNSGSQLYAGTRKPESEKAAQSRMNTESILVPEKSESPILVPDIEEGQL
jgi:hypothetical protein